MPPGLNEALTWILWLDLGVWLVPAPCSGVL